MVVGVGVEVESGAVCGNKRRFPAVTARHLVIDVCSLMQLPIFIVYDRQERPVSHSEGKSNAVQFEAKREYTVEKTLNDTRMT